MSIHFLSIARSFIFCTAAHVLSISYLLMAVVKSALTPYLPINWRMWCVRVCTSCVCNMKTLLYIFIFSRTSALCLHFVVAQLGRSLLELNQVLETQKRSGCLCVNSMRQDVLIRGSICINIDVITGPFGHMGTFKIASLWFPATVVISWQGQNAKAFVYRDWWAR